MPLTLGSTYKCGRRSVALQENRCHLFVQPILCGTNSEALEQMKIIS